MREHLIAGVSFIVVWEIIFVFGLVYLDRRWWAFTKIMKFNFEDFKTREVVFSGLFALLISSLLTWSVLS